MSALLPVLAFAALVISVYNSKATLPLRQAFLRAAGLWASYAILTLELLSLGRFIRKPVLILSWAMLLLVVGFILTKQIRSNSFRWPSLPSFRPWPESLLTTLVIGVLITTALVAWFAPPQAIDTLHYQMSRVAHWAQNHSIHHYTTGVEAQNSRSPGAQIFILHLYVLSGSDRLANFIQWGAFLGCILAASLIAQKLGGHRRSEQLAAVITATIPIAIVQASSAMTDIVVAFWISALAVEALDAEPEEKDPSLPWFLAIHGAVAAFIKPTSIPYLVAFALLLLVKLVLWRNLRLALRWLSIAILVFLLLNGGHYLRSHNTYGAFFNPAETQTHLNELMTPRGILSIVLRNVGLQLSTPLSSINYEIYRLIVGIHFKLGLDLHDPRTTAHGYFAINSPDTYETGSPNPLHFLLILVASTLFIFSWKRRKRPLSTYFFTTMLSFVFFSSLFKWQIWGGRYFISFIVLSIPFAVCLLSECLPSPLLLLVPIVFSGAAWPWLVHAYSRPLISTTQNPVNSILNEPREALYFVNYPSIKTAYTSMTTDIREASCHQLGLMLSGASLEYPIWPLMGAPDDQLRIEWIEYGTPSAQYFQQDFEPCAVICFRCPDDWVTVRDLPLQMDVDSFQLFLSPP